MSRPVRQRRFAALAPLPLVLAACGGGSAGTAPVDPSAPASRAFGIWRPSGPDTCTQEQHDAFVVTGPDGKRYPTWHPPTGPGGCSFGHEHGMDPRGSDLYRDVGDVPFGVANEALAVTDPANPRDEDHVGHKIEWANDVEVRFNGAAGALLSARCDVLGKLHMGTHSRDAFTNNVHEVVYHLKCDEGSELHVTMLTPIGNPGEFRRACDRDVVIQAGTATPANSPRGGGFRAIPDRACIDRFLLVPAGATSDARRALHETWETSNSIRSAEGRTIAFFNPYFQVRNPSRHHDVALTNAVGRPMDTCYEATTDGRRARGGTCASATQDGTVTGIAYDDPRSPFKGDDHFMDLNSNLIRNADGPAVWYTDAYGRNGRREAFPGSVPQRIARMDNTLGDANGPLIGNTGPKGGQGTRAPN
jgi:hypothetical protein